MNDTKFNYNSENVCYSNDVNDNHNQTEHNFNQDKVSKTNQKQRIFNKSEDLLIQSQSILDKSFTQSKIGKKKIELRTKLVHQNDNQLNNNQINFNYNNHQRGNMQCISKPSNTNHFVDISIQMFRYLKHKDLKQKILDLHKREHIFIIKQCWGDALRLREMKNELVILKNKNLYENQDLQLDDETRQFGINMIENREKLIKKRVKMSNSMFYRSVSYKYIKK
jgi:hypothetical protein